MNFITRIRLASVILLLSFNLLWYIVLRSQESSNPDYQLDEPTSSEKIVIGMVSCVGGFHDVGRKINEIKTLDTYSEEPLTLIKSILISAKISLLLIFNVPWRHISNLQDPHLFNSYLDDPRLDQKIIIGIVTCVGGYHDVGRKMNEVKALNAYSEEPLTLIKSVLISAKVYNVKYIDIHIFTDSLKFTAILKKKIQVYSIILNEFVKLRTHFHDVFRSVPSGYQRDFIDNIRRCGYVRLFFPQSLPPEIKEILYLDTDTIVTGNIQEVWNNFKERVVYAKQIDRPTQLAAMIPNSEPGDAFQGIFKDVIAPVPHVPPCGVNSGVIFMNLDAMREFNWPDKVIEIFTERRDTIQGDQQLFNVIFHYNLDRLTLFPCQYNFQHLHCERGLTCKTIITDPGGIYIMHGAGDTFQKMGRSHGRLYEAFKLFNLGHHENFEQRLFEPLRKFYGGLIPSSKGMKTCFGTIGKYLFKTESYINKNISNSIE